MSQFISILRQLHPACIIIYQFEKCIYKAKSRASCVSGGEPFRVCIFRSTTKSAPINKSSTVWGTLLEPVQRLLSTNDMFMIITLPNGTAKHSTRGNMKSLVCNNVTYLRDFEQVLRLIINHFYGIISDLKSMISILFRSVEGSSKNET